MGFLKGRLGERPEFDEAFEFAESELTHELLAGRKSRLGRQAVFKRRGACYRGFWLIVTGYKIKSRLLALSSILSFEGLWGLESLMNIHRRTTLLRHRGA